MAMNIHPWKLFIKIYKMKQTEFILSFLGFYESIKHTFARTRIERERERSEREYIFIYIIAMIEDWNIKINFF